MSLIFKGYQRSLQKSFKKCKHRHRGFPILAKVDNFRVAEFDYGIPITTDQINDRGAHPDGFAIRDASNVIRKNCPVHLLSAIQTVSKPMTHDSAAK